MSLTGSAQTSNLNVLRGKISKVSPYAIDTSLTEEGAAADAKATGDAINKVKKTAEGFVTQHGNNKDNPHGVTKAQVGLGNVDNTSDMNKPVSTAQRQAIIDRFQVGTTKPNSNTLWFNKKENLDDTTGDTHIMTHDLNMGQHKLFGVPTPAADDEVANKGYVNKQIKKAAPRNLIDNGYFDVYYIINQRNAISNNIKAGQYFWDRWVKGTDGTYFVEYGKWCGLAGSMYQIVGDYQRLSGVPVTLAVKIDNSIRLISAKVTYNGMAKILAYTDYISLETDAQNRLIVRIDTGVDVGSNDIAKVIQWAALYEGEYTLDTLLEYQPKGYGAELAECQRYYYKLLGYWKWAAAGICVSNTIAVIPIKLPQAMRVKPTVTIKDTSLVRVRCGAVAGQVPSSVTWDGVNTILDTLQMTCTVTGATEGNIAFLYLDNGGCIEFNADL